MLGVDFDVGIIGGGPAGSGMAAYLARAGVKCAVFERDLFPRAHVGESLVPAVNRVFKDLDLFPQMEAAKFPHKYGAAWTSTVGNVYSHNFRGVDVFEGLKANNHATIRFDEREQPGVDSPYTYHVDRGKFDLMLLQHAHGLGATVYQGVRVNGVDFSNPDHAVLRCDLGKQEVGIRVRMVVDASGRQTLLGNQQKLKRRDPVFEQYALHTWFEGYDRRIVARNQEQLDYIFIHHLPIPNSWVWQIPITDTVTSVGVVTQKSHFAKSRDAREEFFWSCIGSRPEFHDALKRSQQLRPLKEEGDYSYAMNQICGDRFLMIGDAARFVDPIFSTGVSIALNSARFASPDLLHALETGDFRKDSFRKFEATIRRGVKNWYDFICVYYRLNVLFSMFVLDARYRLDVIKLLQGDVYDDDAPEVLNKMRETVRHVERNKDHLLHQYLDDLTGDVFKPTF